MRCFQLACLSLCWMICGCSPVPSPNQASSRIDSQTENETKQEQIAIEANDANDTELLKSRRIAMVEAQLERRGIRDQRVLQAMRRVRRHQFVPPELIDQAYDDWPLPIGQGQTISQPYIVSLMTELVRPQPGMKALDIGTGCGYQAAILAEVVEHVVSIEIVPELAEQAKQRLGQMGYKNIEVHLGDGYRGWVEQAPFDIIVVAAAPDHVPQPLLDQLAKGGRMVIPVGRGNQDLKLIEKDKKGGIRESLITAVRFVPMTGEAQPQKR